MCGYLIVDKTMSITRVKIEGYRSIKNCEFYPTNFCALVGENNSGKSNILRAINTVVGREWLSISSFSDSDFNDYKLENDILIELEFDPPLTHYAYNERYEIPVLRYIVTRYKKKTGRANKGDPRLDTQCLKRDGNKVMVLAEAPKSGKQHQYKPLTSIPQSVKDQIPVIFVGTDRNLSAQMPSTRNSPLRRILQDIDDALGTRTMTINKGDEVVERPVKEIFSERLENTLEVLKVPEVQELEELLRKYSLENLGYDPVEDAERLQFRFGIFDSMDFFKAIKLKFKEGDILLDAADMGEGGQNALIVAIFQVFERLKKNGAIFLIEEPEMFLHPHRRRFFHRTLRKLAKDNQVIYTTHSPDFVTIPDFESVRIVYRDKHDSTNVKASSLKATEILREKLQKEFDPERNELFFAKHVVLVEGDTEKLALPEYASRLSINLDRMGCSIVEVGGKRNLKDFIDIVSSFGMDLTVVFDTDSGDISDKDLEKYNEQLRAYKGAKTKIVELDPKYETVLRKEIGEEEYLKLCTQFPGYSKAVRARLIAADGTSPVPRFIKEIFTQYIKKNPTKDL